jgi:transposase
MLMIAMSGQPELSTTIRVNLDAIFVSLELSRTIWLVTSLSPGNGEKMSRHVVPAGDSAGLFARFGALRDKARARTGELHRLVVIQEAGLDGFWIDRVLRQEDWLESHIVDAASIAVSRRRRRAKADRVDSETLVRTLLAYRSPPARKSSTTSSSEVWPKLS